MHFNRPNFLGVLWNSCLLLQSFWVKNAKNRRYRRKRGFDCSFFYEIEVQVVTSGSTRLEKQQTIEILLRVDFYAFLKRVHFSRFFLDF